jgi:hypothetical protein
MWVCTVLTRLFLWIFKSKTDSNLNTETSPFYFPSSKQLLGMAYFNLKDLLYFTQVARSVVILDSNGNSQGTLTLSVYPPLFCSLTLYFFLPSFLPSFFFFFFLIKNSFTWKNEDLVSQCRDCQILSTWIEISSLMMKTIVCHLIRVQISNLVKMLRLQYAFRVLLVYPLTASQTSLVTCYSMTNHFSRHLSYVSSSNLVISFWWQVQQLTDTLCFHSLSISFLGYKERKYPCFWTFLSIWSA